MASIADIILQNTPSASFMRALPLGEQLGQSTHSAYNNLIKQRLMQQQMAQSQAAMQQKAQEEPARQSLLHAQAAQAQAAIPGAEFKGQHPLLFSPGAAGQFGIADYYMKNYPPGSPEYQMGKSIQDTAKISSQYQQQRGKYYGTRTGMLAFMALPAQQKAQITKQLNDLGYNNAAIMGILNNQGIPELFRVTQNNIPYNEWAKKEAQPLPTPGSIQQSQQTAQEQGAQTQSRLMKQAIPTTQANAIPRANTALNIIGGIRQDLPDLTPYMGAKGKINLASERAKIALGVPPSPSYQKYLSYQQQLPLLINDIRASFTGPQTDAEQRALQALLPANLFLQSPELIAGQLDNLENMINHQKQVTGKNIQQNIEYNPTRDNKERDTYQKTGKQNTVKMTADGKVYEVPADKVNDALKGGMTYAS